MDPVKKDTTMTSESKCRQCGTTDGQYTRDPAAHCCDDCYVSEETTTTDEITVDETLWSLIPGPAELRSAWTDDDGRAHAVVERPGARIVEYILGLDGTTLLRVDGGGDEVRVAGAGEEVL